MEESSATRFASFPSYSSEAEARTVQATYAEGVPTSVSYDPTDPSRAVLEPGSSAATSSLGLTALLSGMVFALGFTVLIQSIGRLKAHKSRVA